ncbi:MAG: dihydrolipoamide acetyltransferase family protein [Halorientalis sp.]
MREFTLPDVGEGVAEGEILQWLVEPGDTVREDQPVVEVETDKAVVEVPAPVDGTVRELRAEPGDVVPVGEVIVVFDVAGEESEGPAGADAEAAPSEGEGGGSAETTADETAASGPETVGGSDEGEAADGRVFAAPSARRLAREEGVDIAAVEGSGPGGRVTAADVRRAAEATGTTTVDSEAEEAAEQGPDRDAAPGETRERTLATPRARGVARELDVDIDAVPASEERDGQAYVTESAVREYAAAQREAQAADAEAVAGGGAGESTASRGEGDERIPYRGVRRTIGERMERAKFTAPHVTHHDRVDVSRLVAARERLQARAADRGVDLTYLPFVLKAVVAGLREYPILNSQLDEEREEIVLRGEYNLGVATATDAGLMVPVVEAADEQSLLELAATTNDLVSRARDRSIDREEMQGGTFTVTNFGAIGGEYATPIVNYPETAILGLGAVRKRPWVVEDEDGDRVEPRHVMTLSLSVDHRVVDGAEAARFTNTVKAYLCDPDLLLLE